jgi:hypothetical protein
MAQPAVESMSGSEDRAPANPDDTAAPDSKGETVLQDSVKDMLKDEEHEEENDMLGTKVLAGEFQAHDPGDDTRPFEYRSCPLSRPSFHRTVTLILNFLTAL